MPSKGTMSIDGTVGRLREILCSLNPDQFERLIVLSLESVLDRRIFHSRGGDQGGRDMATGLLDQVGINVEAKRYQKKLDISQLLGYMQRAFLDERDLDLWIIATTAEVKSQQERVISECGIQTGIGTEIFDLSESGHSKLPKLFIAAGETATGIISSDLGQSEAEDFSAAIESLASVYGYGDFVADNLLENVSLFDLVAEGMRFDLRKRMMNAAQSKLRFNQVVHDAETFVDREQAHSALDSWYTSDGELERLFVFSGDEGVGKTWAVVEWLARKAEQDSLMPVLLTATDGLEMDSIAQGVACYIARVFTEPNQEAWLRRTRRWLTTPRLRARTLLLLDGIDERVGVSWQRVFAEVAAIDCSLVSHQSAAAKPKSVALPTVVTCRRLFWQEHLERRLGAPHYTLQRFSSLELDSYFAKVNRSASDFQNEVRDLMRIPRICGLVIERYEELAASGDISLDRLLLEDARFHLERYEGHRFSDVEFQGLLQRLAEDALEGPRSYWSAELRSLIGTESADDILTDLKTRGVFVPAGGGRHKLEPSRLYLGLGLLLLHRLTASNASTRPNYREDIQRYLDSARGLDPHAAILAAAILGSISELNRDSELVSALLEGFGELQNSPSEIRKRVNGYFPAIHDELRKLAERIALSERGSRFTWKWIEEVYVNAARSMRSTEALEATCCRWVSFVSLRVPLRAQGRDEEERTRRYLRDLLEEQDPVPGTVEVNGSIFHVIDTDGSWRLRDLSLMVVSARSARIPAKLFRDWTLTDGLTRFYLPWDSKMAWLGRFMDQQMADRIIEIVETMLSVDNEVWQEAAYHLSWLLHDPRAEDLRSRSRFKPEPWHSDDDCWRRADWKEDPTYFEREEIPFWSKATRLAQYATDPGFEPPESVSAELMDGLKETMNGDHRDHNELAPAFARWLPREWSEAYLNGLRDFETEIDYETGSDEEADSEQYREHEERLRSLDRWAHYHRHSLPLLEARDVGRLHRAWDIHIRKPRAIRRFRQRAIDPPSTEIGLLRALLAVADPETCVELICSRPETEGSPIGCLRALPVGLSREQYQNCWARLLERSDQELINKIQLLSLEKHDLDSEAIARLITLAQSKEEWADEVAAFAQLSDNSSLMRSLVDEEIGLRLGRVSENYTTAYNIPADISIEHILDSSPPGFVCGIMAGRRDDDYRGLARTLPEFVRKGPSEWSRISPFPTARTRW